MTTCLFIKQKGVHQQLPVGFCCKCSPYVQNTRSLRNRSGHFMSHAEPYSQSLPATLSIAIRESLLMMDWIRLKAELLQRLSHRRKGISVELVPA